ncbi:MAG: dual specificity protein phosphatase family protein [Myxococcota bacterium]
MNISWPFWGTTPSTNGSSLATPAGVASFVEPYPNKPHFYAFVVDSGLVRGAQPTPAQLAVLRDSKKVRSVVSLRIESDGDKGMAAPLGLKRLHIPIIDNTPPTQAQIDTFLKFASNPDNQPVYVHCFAGVGRTGVMVAAYRMAVDGWSVDAALDEAYQFGMSEPSQAAAIKAFSKRLQAGKVPGFPPS